MKTFLTKTQILALSTLGLILDGAIAIALAGTVIGAVFGFIATAFMVVAAMAIAEMTPQ